MAPTSVEIEDGESVILVGPSGCGKSTLLRMIAGSGKDTIHEITRSLTKNATEFN